MKIKIRNYTNNITKYQIGDKVVYTTFGYTARIHDIVTLENINHIAQSLYAADIIYKNNLMIKYPTNIVVAPKNTQFYIDRFYKYRNDHTFYVLSDIEFMLGYEYPKLMLTIEEALNMKIKIKNFVVKDASPIYRLKFFDKLKQFVIEDKFGNARIIDINLFWS